MNALAPWFMLAMTLAFACCGGGGAGESTTATVLPKELFAPHDGPAKSLLLVTLDTTRHDRLGCYGFATARTPFLDSMARNGIVYENAWCAAPITLSSHTTILSGTYPCAHGVRENGAFRVSPNARLMSEVLQENGFRTGAFVGTFILDSKFGLNQGFEVYDAPDASKVSQKWSVTERPAGEVGDAALRYIDTLKPEQRWFLWVHFYDPHYPHVPDPEFVYEGGTPYDAEIRGCDAQLERIVLRLAERGLAQRMVMAVTADHGESLDEHGEESHGIFVYDATMRVPLIVAPAPSGAAPGARSQAPVSNVDLAATLLERLGIARDALPDARTPLLPAGDDDGGGGVDDGGSNDGGINETEERAIYMESLTPFFDHRWHPLQAVVWKGVKFIETRRSELYSLRDDPNELVDVIGTNAELAERMALRLQGLLDEHRPLNWGDAGVLSEEDRGKLAQLAYPANVSIGGNPFDPTLPDAKDHLAELDELDTIVALVRDGAMALDIDGADRSKESAQWKAERREQGLRMMSDAKQRLQKMRERYADDPNIDTMLGMALQGLGQWGEAAEVLERVIARNPDHSANHYNLANAYRAIGRKQWAVREMEKAHHLDPRSLAAARWLVEWSLSNEDWPAAAWWLDVLERMEGQTEADLAIVRDRQQKVNKQLQNLNNKPRAPKPVTDEELKPEGMRARGK